MSPISIAYGGVGSIAAVLMVIGIVVVLTWSWWIGGAICVVAILLVGNDAWRRWATDLVATGMRATRKPR